MVHLSEFVQTAGWKTQKTHHIAEIVAFHSIRGTTMSDVDEEELKLSQNEGIAILISSILLGALLTLGVDGGIGAFVMYFLSSLLIICLFGTKAGRIEMKKFMEDMQEEMNNQNSQQQQQIGAQSSSQPTQVCSECGWKNPKSNNYCHDCGSELDG